MHNLSEEEKKGEDFILKNLCMKTMRNHEIS